MNVQDAPVLTRIRTRLLASMFPAVAPNSAAEKRPVGQLVAVGGAAVREEPR